MVNYREERPGARRGGLDGTGHSRSHQDLSPLRQKTTYDDFVADVKSGLAGAQTDWERRNGTGTFDPVMWIGERLARRTQYAHGEEYQKRSDLSLAWDAITLPYLRSDEYRSTVNTLNTTKVMARGSNVVSLDPEEVALIDAMTQVLRIPLPTGPATVEILKTDTQKEHFRALYGSIHSRRCGI